MVKQFTLGVVLTILGWVEPSLAHTAYVYSVAQNDLYEVVVENPEDKKTDLAPGIYRIDKKSGESVLLLPGKVIGANRSYKGILAHVARNSGADSTHDALTLMDGRVVLFNHNTSPRSPNSAVYLGGRKISLKVMDVIHGTEVEVPAINSIDNIKVFEGPVMAASPELPKGGRLILISLKSPTPFGSGLTMAVVVEGGTTKDHKVKVLENTAWVVGYDFMAEDALERLLAPNIMKSGSEVANITVYSPSMISKFKNQLSKNGGHIARAWMDQLSRFQKYLNSGLPTSTDEKTTVDQIVRGVPVYDILSRKDRLNEVPVETVFHEDQRFIGQTFDPSNGQYKIINQLSRGLVSVKVGRKDLLFGSAATLDQLVVGQLKIDREGDGGAYKLVAEGNPKEQEKEAEEEKNKPAVGEPLADYIFFSDGKPWFLNRNEQSGQMMAVQLTSLDLNPADKFQFVKRKFVAGNSSYVALLILKKSGKEKSKVYGAVLSDGNTPSIQWILPLYDGPSLTFKEFTYRLVEQDGKLLFDNATPVKGSAAYLRVKESEKNKFLSSWNVQVPVKTVPYLNFDSGGTAETYLSTLSEDVLVPGALIWRSYDPFGATHQATGFYLTSKKDPAAKEKYVMGYPLFSKTLGDKKLHVMLSKIIQSSASSTLRLPPVNISVFPFVEKPAKKIVTEKDLPTAKELAEATKFKLGVHFNPEGTTEKIDGQLRVADLDLPFKSLAYTQILQGEKNAGDEFSLLLYFKEDPSIKGSADAVYVIPGVVHWSAGRADEMEVTMSQPIKIHNNFVPPGSAKAHLLIDAEGSYYWVKDPDKALKSTDYKAIKLADPAKSQGAYTGSAQQLRTPDHLKETETGFVSSTLRFGGRWEVTAPHHLRTVVPGFDEYLSNQNKKGSKKETAKAADKDKEKAAAEEEDNNDPRGDKAEQHIFEAFDNYLANLVSKENAGRRHPRVIVVDGELKEKFKTRLFLNLYENDTPISLTNRSMTYFHANATVDDVEFSHELRYITSQPHDRKSLFYVDSELLKEAKIAKRSNMEDASDEEKDKHQRLDHEDELKKSPFPPPEAGDDPNVMVLLATDGAAKSVKGFKRVGNKSSKLPMISIVTPEEWREIQGLHHNELSAGVFNGIEVNNDFLTSSWTVWAPKNNRAAPDMKELLKTPYRPEEMRIFPTLDKILNEAAAGQLKGKQKILIVPNEVKGLVQKLILLRWATPEQSAGNWSYRNKKFALHRIMGANDLQSVIQDNFAAMRGASNFRSSVLYSDLETILRIGRPTADKSRQSFRLKDPLKSTGGYLIDNAQAQVEMEAKAAAQQQQEAQKALPIVETLNDPQEIEEEIGNLNQQINTITANITALERSKLKSAGPPTGADGKIKKLQWDLNLLTKARSALEAKLPDDAPQPQAQDQKRVKSPTDASAYPHLMWWIATEGQAVQPRKEAGWKIQDSVDLEVSTILVGTEEELGHLRNDMAFEGKFFDLDKHFEIVKLEAPSDETKYNLVQQLFERPEVVSLGIGFKLKNDNGREPRSQLIHHFINRVDQLAYDQRIERTAAFIRGYIALKNSLTEDLDLRRARQIDERFIERLFTKVFPMPLNPEILEPHDPLNRLRNVDQAVRDMQEAGYEGSPDLKRRVFENSLSQTRPTDSSKPIPDSQIFHGSTSTGKTFLLRTMFNMLGLVEYNRNKPNNEDADFIFINVAKLTENPKEPDKLTVDDVIADIHDLMSQPNGARARIVFDDAHKASSKAVREKLHQFIQGLFEAPNGMFTVRSKDGKRHREIPVQNLGLYMTINPTANESIRKQFVKDNHRGAELLKREVLAALSGDGFTPEESYLARWSDIINLDNFPRSAKVPGLVKRVRQNAGRSGQMVLVDSKVIDTLIDRFPQAHARELLSPATAALTLLPSSAEKAPMYLVSVRKQSEAPMPANPSAGSVSQQDLQSTVRSFTQVDAIKLNDPRGLYNLMGFVMRNFRLQVFNYMALEAHMSDTLRVNVPGQANVLKTNFLLGVSSHIMENPSIPSGEMVLKHEFFNGVFNNSNIQEIMRYQTSIKEKEVYFPVNLDVQGRPTEFELNSFLKGNTVRSAQAKTRQDVLLDTVARLELVLLKAVQIYLRLESPEQIKEVGGWSEQQLSNWFQKLPEQDQDEAFKKLGQEILNLYFEFMDHMHAPDLSDGSKNKISLNLYDQVRLFSYAMDKAVTRMPWPQIAQFTLKVANLSTDFSLGTRPSFREYVGVHQLSPFTISTPEFINEMMSTTASGPGKALAEKIPQLKKQFLENCELLLTNNNAEGAAQ